MSVYDFDSIHSRVGLNSEKWEEALKAGAPADIVPLTVADMEFASAPIIRQALREVAEGGLWGYTYAGESFKNSIANWMKNRHGWDAKPEWMVHTFGIVQAFYVAVRICSAAGDGVLVQPPVYAPFFNAALQTSRVVVENPLKLVDGRYEIDFEDLDRKLPQVNIMIFSNPHNPAGRVWTKEEVTEVARLCKKHGVPLFSDEIHCDIIMPGHKHYSAGLLPPELLDNCFIGTSASKSFSLAGLSCSTTFVPSYDMRKKMNDRLDADGFYFNNTFGTVATQAAYQGGADWLEEMVDYVHENYRYLQDFMEKNIPGFKVMPMEGTYLAWVDFSGLRMSGDELNAFLHNEAKLYLNDGRMFGQGGLGFGRFNLACPRKVLADALDRLHAAVEKRAQ